METVKRRTINMVKKIGAITIGQTPRSDVLFDMEPLMNGIKIIQRGALDGLTPEELKSIEPKDDDYILVTRLHDGSSVLLAEKHILPRIQKHIDDLVLNEDVDGIVMLCTGEFPQFKCSVPLLYPQILLQHFILSVLGENTLGVLSPAPGQIPQSKKRWLEAGVTRVVSGAASPYDGFEDVIIEANKIVNQGAKILVLDCIGYTQKMKETIYSLTGVPVILGRTVAARAVAELFG